MAVVNAQLGWVAEPDHYKVDYDRVNDVLQDSQAPISQKMVDYYDASFGPGLINDFTNSAVLTLLVEWRNLAWVNGVSLYLNPSDLNRGVVETTAGTTAVVYMTPNIPSPQASRRQYCQTHP